MIILLFIVFFIIGSILGIVFYFYYQDKKDLEKRADTLNMMWEWSDKYSKDNNLDQIKIYREITKDLV